MPSPTPSTSPPCAPSTTSVAPNRSTSSSGNSASPPSPTLPADLGLGLTIGNAHVSLLELTNAYATLARQGQHLPTTFQLDHFQLLKPVKTVSSRPLDCLRKTAT